jgi:PilZ domain
LQTGAKSGTKTETKIDARRFPRLQMEVDVNIFSQKNGVAPGRSVDISESGMSAVLPVELIIGETVKLEIRFPVEPATVIAVVRSRNAFRYGFEFKQPQGGKEPTGKDLVRRVPRRPDLT